MRILMLPIKGAEGYNSKMCVLLLYQVVLEMHMILIALVQFLFSALLILTNCLWSL